MNGSTRARSADARCFRAGLWRPPTSACRRRNARAPGLGRFRHDERGVSEAVGYILTFGISTVILITSLHTFTVIQHHTEDLARDRGADEIVEQVAYAVEQAIRAGSFGASVENHYNHTVTLPQALSGSSYRVELTDEYVFVNVTIVHSEGAERDGLGRAEVRLIKTTSAEVLCRGQSTTIEGGTCGFLSTSGDLTVTYSRTTVNGVPDQWGVYFRPPIS